MNFELGTKVKITNTALPQYGLVGTVERVSENIYKEIDYIGVKFDNNLFHAFNIESVAVII
jgi:hypothetical protein